MDSTDHTNQSEDVLARRGQDLQEEGPSIPLKYFQPQGTMQTGIIEAHPYDSNGSIWSECSEILRHSPMPQNQTVYPQNHSTNAGYQLNGYHQQEMSLDQILSLPQNMTFQAQMPLHMDSSLQAEIYSLQHVSLLQCQDDHPTNASHRSNGFYQHEMLFDNCDQLRSQSMTHQAQESLPMNPSLQAASDFLQALLSTPYNGPLTGASYCPSGIGQQDMLLGNQSWSTFQNQRSPVQATPPICFNPQAADDLYIHQPQPLYSSTQCIHNPIQLQSQPQGELARLTNMQMQMLESNIQTQKSQIRVQPLQTCREQEILSRPIQGSIRAFNYETENPTLPRRKGNIYAPQLRTDASASSLQHSEVEEPSGSNARKRRRNQITLEEKIAVVKYADMNPDATAIQLGKHFKLCRTTIYGIMSKAKELLAAELLRVPSSLNLCRLQEARFRILEELLVDWVKILWSQQICVPAKKIMAQGMEIYTMLSHFLSVPWEPCSFTSGWLKGFQRRQFRLASDGNEMAKKRFLLATPKNDLKSIRVGQYKMGDIYSCEMTGMNLNLNLPNLAQDKGRDMAICKSELSSVTIVACFNATGSDKREPLVLVRQAGFGILNTKRYHDMVDGTKTEDLINYTFFSWLIEFDSSLVRRTLLMVDEAIWNLLKSDCTDFQSVLKWIVVVKVPMGHAGSSPMSARIAKEFKSRYYFHLIEALNRQAQRVELNDKNRAKLNYLEDYLSLIKLAWEKIHHSTIKCLFQRFLKPIGLPADCSAENGQDFLLPPDNYSNNLFNALRSFFPDAKDTVIQHFVYFDKDTGPSSSLRRGIYRMHRHPDFSNSFRNVGFGIVRVASLNSRSRPAPYVQASIHGSVRVPMPRHRVDPTQGVFSPQLQYGTELWMFPTPTASPQKTFLQLPLPQSPSSQTEDLTSFPITTPSLKAQPPQPLLVQPLNIHLPQHWAPQPLLETPSPQKLPVQPLSPLLSPSPQVSSKKCDQIASYAQPTSYPQTCLPQNKVVPPPRSAPSSRSSSPLGMMRPPTSQPRRSPPIWPVPALEPTMLPQMQHEISLSHNHQPTVCSRELHLRESYQMLGEYIT